MAWQLAKEFFGSTLRTLSLPACKIGKGPTLESARRSGNAGHSCGSQKSDNSNQHNTDEACENHPVVHSLVQRSAHFFCTETKRAYLLEQMFAKQLHKTRDLPQGSVLMLAQRYQMIP